MSRQLELDINRPSWHESNYKTDVSSFLKSNRDLVTQDADVTVNEPRENKEVLVAEYSIRHLDR